MAKNINIKRHIFKVCDRPHESTSEYYNIAIGNQIEIKVSKVENVCKIEEECLIVHPEQLIGSQIPSVFR